MRLILLVALLFISCGRKSKDSAEVTNQNYLADLAEGSCHFLVNDIDICTEGYYFYNTQPMAVNKPRCEIDTTILEATWSPEPCPREDLVATCTIQEHFDVNFYLSEALTLEVLEMEREACNNESGVFLTPIP